jgi:hypothetical protein
MAKKCLRVMFSRSANSPDNPLSRRSTRLPLNTPLLFDRDNRRRVLACLHCATARLFRLTD